MEKNHGTTALSQFGELAAIVLQALSKALEGLDIKELLKALNANVEKIPNALHHLLASFINREEKTPDPEREEEIMTFPQYRKILTGEREYEIIPAAQRHESFIAGKGLIERAENQKTNLGEEEARHILHHQDKIIPVLRKTNIVFTNWRSEDGQLIAYIAWNGKEWDTRWRLIDQDWQQAYSWWLIKRLK